MRALGSLSSDEVLEVVLDNPPSVRDIPPVLKEKGYEVSETERVEKTMWKIVVQTKK
jgi:TusA-related sulfurtransferase